MDAENTADRGAVIAETIAARKKSSFANPFIWLQTIVFLLGLGLLAYLIYRIGASTLVDTISRVGWGMLLIVFLNGARHFLRAWCIYLAIPPKLRTFKFRHAFAARLGGEAVGVLTFTGPFLGDATKAALLRRDVPLVQGGAAIVVDNILYYTSVLIMVLGGVGLMTYAFSSNQTMKYALGGITAAAALFFGGLALLLWFRIKPISWLIKKFGSFAPQFITRKKDAIFELETNVHDFYNSRRTAFFAVLTLIVLSHALSVAEVYAALRLLDYPATVSIAYIIESLMKFVNFAFSFVPGGVGIYEGGSGVILKTLGYTTAVGVALALVRRGAILTWTFAGLLILLWRTVSRNR